MASEHPRTSPRAGFTLIELLAVVLILGLLATVVAPAVGFGSARALRADAERLADALEFARQRAVMTGRRHRVVLDLDWVLYRVEWIPPAEPDPQAGDPLRPAPGSTLVSLSPPERASDEFVPIPLASFGNEQPLAENVGFLGVELESRTVKRGSVAIGFEPDGLADPATIWLADLDGDENRVLELRPLADAVVVYDEFR